MKRFCLCLILFLACNIYLQAKTYLVCAGVADYPGTKNDLRVSDNDAQTIAKVFSAAQHASVNMLLNKDVTQTALLSTMQSLFANADSNDAVILYFSGHGTPGALACYDGLLTYQRIFNILKGCKASRKMIIVDACFSGRMRKGSQQSTGYSTQNVMLFLSSRTQEPSRETQFKNSLFTIFLERGLRGGADKNKDRQITARELFDFVHQGVIEGSGGKQHPVMWGKFDNNMTIVNW